MATTNTKYIISTKKNTLYRYCIGFYINKGVLYYIYQLPIHIYEQMPEDLQKCTKNLKELMLMLQLMKEY